jgi:hypothetical protein
MSNWLLICSLECMLCLLLRSVIGLSIAPPRRFLFRLLLPFAASSPLLSLPSLFLPSFFLRSLCAFLLLSTPPSRRFPYLGSLSSACFFLFFLASLGARTLLSRLPPCSAGVAASSQTRSALLFSPLVLTSLVLSHLTPQRILNTSPTPTSPTTRTHLGEI